MRVHILRKESVTPIQRYLERAREAPASFPVQKEFSALVLYREREYRTMFSSSLMAGAVSPRSPDSPFAPFDLTDAGADVLAATATLDLSLRLPFDLFGLKPEAINRLTSWPASTSNGSRRPCARSKRPRGGSALETMCVEDDSSGSSRERSARRW